jgi:hypothetical protein
MSLIEIVGIGQLLYIRAVFWRGKGGSAVVAEY